MPQNFIGCDREQELLLPASLREWLPEGHLAWFVLAAVEEMDLAAFYGAYRLDGHGRAAHDPGMMGRIQLVVATLDVEELRCLGRIVLGSVPVGRGRVARDVRLLVVGNIGSG